jgi:hypothetical protein
LIRIAGLLDLALDFNKNIFAGRRIIDLTREETGEEGIEEAAYASLPQFLVRAFSLQ